MVCSDTDKIEFILPRFPRLIQYIDTPLWHKSFIDTCFSMRQLLIDSTNDVSLLRFFYTQSGQLMYTLMHTHESILMDSYKKNVQNDPFSLDHAQFVLHDGIKPDPSTEFRPKMFCEWCKPLIELSDQETRTGSKIFNFSVTDAPLEIIS